MSCFGVEIRDIVIVILTILIAYLFYKTRKVEGFADATVSDMVRQAVNDTYLVDISAMRNLANISQDIMSNKDDLTLPTNITIPGNLKVDGNVFFTNKNTNLMNLFPKFMIIALNNSEGIPKGWAMCDGKKYKMDPLTGVVSLLNMETIDADSIITPDLRGRMILGGGEGTGLTNRTLNQNGGKEIMTANDMPAHTHDVLNLLNHVGCDGTNCGQGHGGAKLGRPITGKSGPAYMSTFLYSRPNELPTSTGIAGAGGSQNNMPPFYVLMYIMKL